MITSIVVGFDGSEAAARALQMGCALALKFDAKLEVSHTPLAETVTYAAEAISGFYVGPTAVHDEMLLEAAEKMAERARDIAAEAGMAGVEVHIGHGDPAENVLARAKAILSDLESGAPLPGGRPASLRGRAQLELFAAPAAAREPSAVERTLRELDVDRLRPLDALVTLARLKDMLET